MLALGLDPRVDAGFGSKCARSIVLWRAVERFPLRLKALPPQPEKSQQFTTFYWAVATTGSTVATSSLEVRTRVRARAGLHGNGLAMTQSTAFGDKFGERLRCDSAPAFVSRSLRNTTIAVTEIKSDNPVPGPSSSLAREDAFLVALQVRDYPVHEYFEEGRAAPVTSLRAGDTTIYDIKRDPVFNINNPFHSIHFYFPRAALNAIADNAGVPRIGDLRYQPGVGIDDPIMRRLALSLLPAFEHPEQVSRLFAEHITLAVGVHAARTYGDMRPARIVNGGLAPWQERRAKEIVDANLDGAVPLKMLADECGLSVGHFARAFRQSTGMTPHQWLTQRRIETAKSLLRDRRYSVSEVALACGFSDQSHFTRVYTRAMGTSPGAWRRQLDTGISTAGSRASVWMAASSASSV
jgi:AraC family transcriptional regulator